MPQITNPSLKNSPARFSFKATWQAICGIPTDHFPLILPGAHQIAVWFILKQLKRLGFSNCLVTKTGSGLVVHAHR
jgi:hypothetical protein